MCMVRRVNLVSETCACKHVNMCFRPSAWCHQSQKRARPRIQSFPGPLACATGGDGSLARRTSSAAAAEAALSILAIEAREHPDAVASHNTQGGPTVPTRTYAAERGADRLLIITDVGREVGRGSAVADAAAAARGHSPTARIGRG